MTWSRKPYALIVFLIILPVCSIAQIDTISVQFKRNGIGINPTNTYYHVNNFGEVRKGTFTLVTKQKKDTTYRIDTSKAGAIIRLSKQIGEITKQAPSGAGICANPISQQVTLHQPDTTLFLFCSPYEPELKKIEQQLKDPKITRHQIFLLNNRKTVIQKQLPLYKQLEALMK